MEQPVFKPIGVVRNQFRERRGGGWSDVVSEIVMDEELEESLEGLEDFSHIIVVFWMHKSPPPRRPPGKIHPRGRADLPLVGMFATRTPHRPNPVGVTCPRLLERRRNVLVVKGLDAIDGTPVLDIKPHLPRHDASDEFHVPDWVRRAA